MRYDMELVTGDLNAVKDFLRERQNLARADAGILDFEFYFSAPRSVTLLACYADAAAQQRSFIRWMKAEEMKSVLAVRDIYTYGRVALEPGAAPPRATSRRCACCSAAVRPKNFSSESAEGRGRQGQHTERASPCECSRPRSHAQGLASWPGSFS